MSTTPAKKIEYNLIINAERNHVSAPWAHDLRVGRAVCRFSLGDGT
jgi:hypothetical protein